MAQDFAVPTKQLKTLKVLVWGPPKSGKSHFCATAADVGPLLWMDTEHGSDYYDSSKGLGFKVAYSADPEVAIRAIQYANQEKGDRPVVAIDSFSSLWFAQQEVAEEITKKSGGRSGASFRAWGPAKKPLKRLYNEIMLSKCHTVLTARAKTKYTVSSSGAPTEAGLEADVEKGLPFAVDIILEMKTDGNKYIAVVDGSRSSALTRGQVLENPSFKDLLVAVQPGDAPTQVEDTVDLQAALGACESYSDLFDLVIKFTEIKNVPEAQLALQRALNVPSDASDTEKKQVLAKYNYEEMFSMIVDMLAEFHEGD